jgi:hypothetical protein
VICEQAKRVISVLVIGGADADKAACLAGSPSLEVLTAHGLEDALEKLGRNRRIDAVLLLDRRDAGKIVEAIRQDIPAHPPIFVPGPARDAPAGTRPLPATDPAQLLKLLARAIEA